MKKRLIHGHNYLSTHGTWHVARVGLKYASDKAHEMLLLRSLHVMIKRDPHVPTKKL